MILSISRLTHGDKTSSRINGRIGSRTAVYREDAIPAGAEAIDYLL